MPRNQKEVMERRLAIVAAGAGTAAAVIGAAYLFAWLSGTMTHLGAHAITIKANASLCVLLCGAALSLILPGDPGRLRRILAQVFAVVAMTVGGLTVLEHLLGWDFGIDQLLARELPGAMGVFHPNRMGPPGATSFTLAGAAILLLIRRRPHAVRAAQWLALLLCLIALLGMLGYLYGVTELYGAARFTAIAWQATVAILLLGTGLLLARPGEGLMAPITSTDPGGVALRRLLLPAIILPIALGWLRLQGEWHGLYERYYGTSILVLSWIVIFSLLVYQTGKRLSQSSKAERSAIDALRESEEKYRSLFEASPDAILITVPDGSIVSANPAAEAMFGMTEEEICRVGRQGLVDVEDARLGPLLQERARTGRSRGVLTYMRKDGSRFEGDLVSVILDPHGRAFVIIRDITERVRAEEALREREEQLHLFIEHAPAALAMFDRGMHYLSASRHWRNIYGLGERDLTGLSHYEVFPEISREWKEAHRRGLAGEVMRAEADRFERADGSVQWVRWEIRPWYGGAGNVGGIVIFAEDITDRKRADEELRKAKDELEIRVRERTAELSHALKELKTETDERIRAVEELRAREQMLMQQNRLAAMGEMLVNISHQWRQPLNVLALVLQELYRSHQRGDFTGDFLESSVARARQLIAHMSQTIDDFRNYLNPEKARASFEVREVVERAIAMVGESLKDVQIDVLALPDEAVFINGYRNEYGQAIINILINARDAFQERGIANPRITVKIFKVNGKAAVSIADNAGGIAPDIIDRIFEPYFTTKGPDKGTGIGLFMARTIIEKNMRGALTVRNLDQGAEFRIEV